MQNKKLLAILSLLRKVFDIFSSIFLSIYLFGIMQGDFNFLLLYAAFNAIVGCIMDAFLMKVITSRNANSIFRLGFTCEIVGILILLIMKENLTSIIWPFALVQRFAKVAYYAVYEVTLIRSTKTHSLSSYVAGINILSSIIALVAPLIMGFTITNFSWHIIFIMMLVDAILSAVVAMRVNFKVINDKFRPIKFWKKAFHNKNMRSAYCALFFRRLSGTDGVLEYLLPILLFLALGTEFSVGNYDSLFSIAYIILLELVRVLNKKGATKKFYIPFALLTLASAIFMVVDFSIFSILLFYFTIKTGGAVVMLEGSSMIYAIGNKEKMAEYTREHQLTWNIFLALGNITGITIAYFTYNNFYNQGAFAVVICVLMIFFVVYAYVLQKIENVLQNA